MICQREGCEKPTTGTKRSRYCSQGCRDAAKIVAAREYKRRVRAEEAEKRKAYLKAYYRANIDKARDYQREYQRTRRYRQRMAAIIPTRSERKEAFTASDLLHAPTGQFANIVNQILTGKTIYVGT